MMVVPLCAFIVYFDAIQNGGVLITKKTAMLHNSGFTITIHIIF